jgi:hypothetical protein
VLDVQFGSKPDGLGYLTGDEGVAYANKRAEIWGAMRAWLKSGGAIPPNPELASQLTNVQYGFNVQNAIVLEKKEDMKKRGLSSPDIADALALTFSQYVGPIAGVGKFGDKITVESDYDPIAAFEKEIGHERYHNPYANVEL